MPSTAPNLQRYGRQVFSPHQEYWSPASQALGRAAKTSLRARRLLQSLAASPEPGLRFRSLPGIAVWARHSSTAVRLLTRMQSDEDPRVRASSTALLGTARQPQLLRQASESADSATRACAAFAWPALARRKGEALERLEKLASDAHAQVRGAALEALGRMAKARPAAVARIVREAASSSHRDPHTWRGIAQALSCLLQKDESSALPVIADLSLSSMALARWAAARALSGGKPAANKRVHTVVARLLEDKNSVVRCEAVKAAGGILSSSSGPFYSLLRRAASGDDDLTAAAALEAMALLCAQADPRAIALVETFSHHHDPFRRQAAANALASAALKGVGAARQIIRRMAADTNPSIRAAAAHGLRPAELTKLLWDSFPRVRAASIRAATSLGPPALKSLSLESLVTDSSASVRRGLAAGCEVLASRGHQRGFQILLALAPDPVAREAAGQALAHALVTTEEMEEIIASAALGDSAEGKLVCLKMAVLEPEARRAVSLWLDLLKGPEETAARAAASLARRRAISPPIRRWCLAAPRCLRAQSLEDVGRCCFAFRSGRSALDSLAEVAELARKAALSAARGGSERRRRAMTKEDASTTARLLQAAMSALSQAMDGAGSLQPLPGRVLTLICKVWMPLLKAALLALSARPELEAELPVNRLLVVPGNTVPVRVRNRGAGFAEGVHLGLGTRRVRLGQIAPGEEKETQAPLPAVIWRQRAKSGIRRHRQQIDGELTVDIRFRSPPGGSQRVRVTKNVQFLIPSKTFRPLQNLYAPGKPLEAGSPLFFGRQEIFSFLRHALSSRQPRVVVALAGQRRCGKTSILDQLSQRLGDICWPVVIDAQGLEAAFTPQFRYRLARAAQRSLSQAGLIADAPDEAEMGEGPDSLLQYLESASQLAAPRPVLLAFDEFDDLDRKVRQGLLPEQVFLDLRYVLQHSNKVAFLLCGTHSLEELGASYWSFLFNLAVYKRIGPLEHEACLELAARPMEAGGVLADDNAAQAIVELCDAQPYFIQLVCHMLVEQLDSLRRNYLTARDIWHSAPALAQAADMHLRYLWELAAPVGRALLCLMAYSEPDVHIHDLASRAEARGLRIEPEELSRAMSHMHHNDLVTRTCQRYRIAMGLLSHWIRANWTAEAAARLAVSPAAKY